MGLSQLCQLWLLITPIKILIPLLTKSHDPPSMLDSRGSKWWLVLCWRLYDTLCRLDLTFGVVIQVVFEVRQVPTKTMSEKKPFCLNTVVSLTTNFQEHRGSTVRKNLHELDWNAWIMTVYYWDTIFICPHNRVYIWEFPKIRGTLFKDPTF